MKLPLTILRSLVLQSINYILVSLCNYITLHKNIKIKNMPALKWELQVKINTNDMLNTLTLIVIIHCYAKNNIDSNTHTHTHIAIYFKISSICYSCSFFFLNLGLLQSYIKCEKLIIIYNLVTWITEKQNLAKFSSFCSEACFSIRYPSYLHM